MTTDDLTALQALLAKMTPGVLKAQPIDLEDGGVAIVAHIVDAGRVLETPTNGLVLWAPMSPYERETRDGQRAEDNAAGIVALVNAAPALLASAARAAELEAEVSRLRSAIDWQAAAVRTLRANEETEINRLRKQQQQWHQAVASLDSEREANAMLTAEVERLQRILTALGAA